MGKTFNSQKGGQTSARMFHDSTLDDWAGAAAAIPPGRWDGVMVETWYSFPQVAIPETRPFTTAYTALEVFGKVPR